MQFQDLPEYAKQAASNALSDRLMQNIYAAKGEAKEIRAAFIELYSEDNGPQPYKPLDAAVAGAVSIFSKQYTEHGEYTGFVVIEVEKEAGKERVIINKNKVAAVFKEGDDVTILFSHTAKNLRIKGINAYEFIDKTFEAINNDARFSNMFLYAQKGIEGISKEQPALKTGQDVGGNGYMEVISANNERLMINCDGIVAISESKGKGARIIFKSGMTEDVDMEYQTVVDAVLSAIKKRWGKASPENANH